MLECREIELAACEAETQKRSSYAVVALALFVKTEQGESVDTSGSIWEGKAFALAYCGRVKEGLQTIEKVADSRKETIPYALKRLRLISMHNSLSVNMGLATDDFRSERNDWQEKPSRSSRPWEVKELRLKHGGKNLPRTPI